jgi:hypothetical protein
MDNRQSYITVISKRLSLLQLEVEALNSLNLTDINVYAENFYRDFFNILGYEFDNTNFYDNNFAHIDLIDTKNKLAIQVTSQNDNVKIQESIDGFFSEKKFKDYKLKIL